jgi:nitroreductase
MSMIDLLRTRRSIRKYTKDRIDGSITSVLMEALLRSPSSRNINPWEFILVDDRELLSKLARTREHGSSHLQDAALGIVVVADSKRSDVWVEDCSIAAILVQITAHDLGLGSCWIQIRNRDHSPAMSAERYVQELLGLPEHVKVECMVSIGHPGETKKPVPASALDHTKIKRNHYSRTYTSEKES